MIGQAVGEEARKKEVDAKKTRSPKPCTLKRFRRETVISPPPKSSFSDAACSRVAPARTPRRPRSPWPLSSSPCQHRRRRRRRPRLSRNPSSPTARAVARSGAAASAQGHLLLLLPVGRERFFRGETRLDGQFYKDKPYVLYITIKQCVLQSIIKNVN